MFYYVMNRKNQKRLGITAIFGLIALNTLLVGMALVLSRFGMKTYELVASL